MGKVSGRYPVNPWAEQTEKDFLDHSRAAARVPSTPRNPTRARPERPY